MMRNERIWQDFPYETGPEQCCIGDSSPPGDGRLGESVAA